MGQRDTSTGPAGSAREKRTLLVANPGGHLQQLRLLDSRLPFDAPRVWVTTDTAQARSLLAGEEVVYVDDVGSRGYRAAARNLVPAFKVLRQHKVVAAVSTGSGLALPFLGAAALRRIPTHYIESATRTNGPSLTGKLLRRMPGVTMHTQHAQWADDTWNHPGSVFDGFELSTHANSHDSDSVRSVVVSLGTQRVYGFRRLIERLIEILPGDVDVLWQTGSTDVTGLDIEARDQVPSAELQSAIEAADVLIAHAGTGIALTAFQAGKSPVLVPREHNHGEHVDDHQTLTADLLDATGLAVVRRVEALDWGAIQKASRGRVGHAGANAKLKLD